MPLPTRINLNDEQTAFGRRKQQFKSCKNNNYFQKNQTNKVNGMKKHKEKFKYGNYHQYYGYRNPGSVDDSRLSCLKREWFQSKDVLDIGSNAGYLTLSIARDMSPSSIVGIDIDVELVKMSQKNVRHYIDYDIIREDFPISLVLCYGPVAQSMDPKYRYSAGNFPFNVQFVHGNYILPSDEALEWQEPFFDTILCFSLTKWIHLNWGDVGVKRLFHRAYAHLRPGGIFLLEAQAYETYAKRKRITEETLKNFNEIKFFPKMFNEYLLKEVGFQSCELIDTPAHSSKGFKRPIYLFIKGDTPTDETKRKHVFYDSESDLSCNYSDVEQFSD